MRFVRWSRGLLLRTRLNPENFLVIIHFSLGFSVNGANARYSLAAPFVILGSFSLCFYFNHLFFNGVLWLYLGCRTLGNFTNLYFSFFREIGQVAKVEE